MAPLVVMLGLGLVASGWTAGDIGGVQGGGYHSAIPISEPLQFGDLKTTIQRTSVQVPEEYGKLIQITPTKGAAMLWFQSDDGIIRNVIIANDNLWIIQRDGGLANGK